MAKTITQLSVFVSSPSGLDDQRAAVNSALVEANKILSREGIQLEPFFWERHAIPGKVSGDAQAIINRQLENHTDLLIVLMHSRVGSATTSAISGTIEEFDIMSSLIESGKRADICVYFCMQPISPLSDLDQLVLVQGFRKRVQSSGLLTRDYDAPADLLEVMIAHLVEKARRLSGGAIQSQLPTAPSAFARLVAADSEQSDEDEGLGPLDYEEIVVERLAVAARFMNLLTDTLAKQSKSVVAETDRLNDLTKQIALGLPVDKRSITDGFAEMLQSHMDELEPIVLGIEESMSPGMSATLSLVQEWPMFSSSRAGLDGLRDAVAGLIPTASTLLENVGITVVAIQGLLGLTQKVKKAKSRAKRIYSRLMDVLRKSVQSMSATVELANRRLDGDWIEG